MKVKSYTRIKTNIQEIAEDGKSFAPKRLNKWIRKGFVVKDLSIVFVNDFSIIFGCVN